MKVAVYGGSFNPFGKNHEAAVAWLVEQYDQVWVVPAVAHSDKPYLPSYHHRLRMTERGCRRFGAKVIVSTIEADMLSAYPNPILTYDVLREIEARLRGPGTPCSLEGDDFIECIHFAVGEDVRDSMDTWDRIELTRTEFGVVIVPTQPAHATEVRTMIASGDENWVELVPPAVVEYIRKTPALYQKTPLSLFLITRKPGTRHGGWDTYSSAVVRAQSAEHARLTHPGGDERWDLGQHGIYKDNTWVNPCDVNVTYLGPSLPGHEPGVVCANFNNG